MLMWPMLCSFLLDYSFISSCVSVYGSEWDSAHVRSECRDCGVVCILALSPDRGVGDICLILPDQRMTITPTGIQSPRHPPTPKAAFEGSWPLSTVQVKKHRWDGSATYVNTAAHHKAAFINGYVSQVHISLMEFLFVINMTINILTLGHLSYKINVSSGAHTGEKVGGYLNIFRGIMATMKSQLLTLTIQVNGQKERWWPRGLCGTLLTPWPSLI